MTTLTINGERYVPEAAVREKAAQTQYRGLTNVLRIVAERPEKVLEVEGEFGEALRDLLAKAAAVRSAEKLAIEIANRINEAAVRCGFPDADVLATLDLPGVILAVPGFRAACEKAEALDWLQQFEGDVEAPHEEDDPAASEESWRVRGWDWERDRCYRGHAPTLLAAIRKAREAR